MHQKNIFCGKNAGVNDLNNFFILILFLENLSFFPFMGLQKFRLTGLLGADFCLFLIISPVKCFFYAI